MTLTESRRNGTSGAAMPIQTVTIELDEIGYPDWYVTMRTNPRASVYDDFTQQDVERWWAAFGQIVIAWNLADEDGKPLPHPKEVASEKDLDLPISLLAHVLTRYFEAVRDRAAIPKAPSDNSAPSSSTSEGSLRNG
jgi:hypothetical protein